MSQQGNYINWQLFPQQWLQQLERTAGPFLQVGGNWDNHKPLLYIGLKLTGQAPVVEYGSGDGSTAALRAYCQMYGRAFISYDNSEAWAERTNSAYVPDWQPFPEHYCGLALIDHAPGERRVQDAINVMHYCEVMVLHDTEVGGAGAYGWERLWPQFKYHLHLNRHAGGAGASLVSNKYDVTVLRGLQFGVFKFDSE